MGEKLVHEIIPFNTPPHRFPVYLEAFLRKIGPETKPGIFHYHENLELIFCNSGKMQITLLEKKIILEPNDFLFINSNTPHSTDPYIGENSHYYIKLDPTVLDIKASHPMPKPGHFLSMLPGYIIFRKSEDSEQIHALFQRALDNYSHIDFTKRLFLYSSVWDIMAYVFDKGLEKSFSTESYRKSEVLLKALDFIDQNIATVTLEAVAKNASISYSYFSLLFKQFCGISFPKYVSKLRVEKSLAYLSNSSLSITEIAAECGFSNLSHYVKSFKAERGITPNKFRLLVKNRDRLIESSKS